MTDQPTATANRCRCICPNGCDCGCTCLAAIELRAEQRARREANGGPIRVQRKRIAGWRKPEGAVYVGRPTRFGNPARIIPAGNRNGGLLVQWGANGAVVGTWPADGLDARRYAAELYASWINQPEQEDTRALFRALLHGRDLTCWCPLPAPGQPDHCHAAVLLKLANQASA
jgi:hypothetical protein